MNLELFNVATQGVTALGTLLINEDQVRLNKHAVGLLSLTDEELRAACRRALRGEDVQEPRGGESLLPSSVSMEVEEVSGNLKVKADCGASPHVYGILCAWLLYEFLNLGGVAARVSLSPPPLAFTLAAAYFAVVAGNIAYTMGRKFSAEMWQADLNARLHTLKDVRNDAELRQKPGGAQAAAAAARAGLPAPRLGRRVLPDVRRGSPRHDLPPESPHRLRVLPVRGEQQAVRPTAV